MKKLLAIILLSLVSSASYADRWRHGGGHYVYRPDYGWVVPTVIGGVIVYEVAQQRRTEIVVVQPQPVYPPPAAPLWPQPAGYHWEALIDPSCNCYKPALVPN
jgi:hypothetical protein